MIITKPYDKEAISTLYNARPDELKPITLEYILSDDLSDKNQIYCFYTDDLKTLLGVIFFTENKECNLFVNGFSVPKNMKNVITALMLIIKSYNCDLYADTTSKAAVRVLKLVGFKKVKENIYRRLKDGKR